MAFFALALTYLRRRMARSNPVAITLDCVGGSMLLWTLGVGLLTSDPVLAYWPYQVSYVVVQWALAAVWGLFWWETRDA